MASKKASVAESPRSEKNRGRAPKAAITSQARLVMMKAWRRLKPCHPDCVVRIIDTPANSVTAAAVVKTCQSALPTAASTTAGIIMATAMMHSRTPRMKTMGRKSIMGVARGSPTRGAGGRSDKRQGSS